MFHSALALIAIKMNKMPMDLHKVVLERAILKSSESLVQLNKNLWQISRSK